jgi:Diacylglycerol acyltransferase
MKQSFYPIQYCNQYSNIERIMVGITKVPVLSAPSKDESKIRPTISVVTSTQPQQESSVKTTSQFTHNLLWFTGMCMACCFSMVYFIAPFYILSSLIVMIYYYHRIWVWIYVTPILISAILPPLYMPHCIRYLSPMLVYFDYTEIHETKPIHVAEEISIRGKNYLCIFQPHGVISFVGILSAIYHTQPKTQSNGVAKELRNNSTGSSSGTTDDRVIPPTAVATALLYTPILKHVLGIFGLISASKHSIQTTLKKRGVQGTIVLYVGGMAELFLSCHQQEKLYLLKRKGFIKLALQEGIDIVPVYLFGNTTVLSILKTGFLANLSRKVCSVVLLFLYCRFLLLKHFCRCPYYILNLLQQQHF